MTDGRNQRSVKTKAKIMAAGRRLMLAGNFRPGMVETAHAAKVSQRSVFQHYTSLAGLHAALLDDAILRVAIYNQVTNAIAPCDVDRIAHAAVFGRPRQ